MQDIEFKKLEKSFFYKYRKYFNSRLYQNCYKILWKQQSLYMQFLLINVVKFNVFLNTAQTQSTMCRNCFSFDQNATLQFKHVIVPV